MKLARFITTLLALTFALSATEKDQAKNIANLELNISVLKEQYDYTVSQLESIRAGLPHELGLYEGKLVGKYELETQIRKQQQKLAKLKGEATETPELLTLINKTPLKLLVTYISEEETLNQVDYFLYPDMELKVPTQRVSALQISDYRENSIYLSYL